MSKLTGYMTASGVWLTLASITEVNDGWDALARLAATALSCGFCFAAFGTIFRKEGR